MNAFILTDREHAILVEVIWDADRVTVKTKRNGARTQPGDLTVPLAACRGGSTAMEASLRSQEYASGARGNVGPMTTVETHNDDVGSQGAQGNEECATGAYLVIDAASGERFQSFLEGRTFPPGVQLHDGRDGRAVAFTAGPSIAFPKTGLPGGGSVVVGTSAFAFALATVAKGCGEMMIEDKSGQSTQVLRSQARNYLYLLGDKEKEVARAFGLQDGMQEIGSASRVTEALVF